MENQIKKIIIQALGNTKGIDVIANNSYEKKPKEYYAAYRNSTSLFDEFNFFDFYPAIRKPTLEKLSGIVELSFVNKNFLELYSIIKKAHPKIFKCIMSNTKISFDKWRNVLMSEKEFLEDMSELEIFCNMGVFSFLLYIETTYNKRHIQIENVTNIFDYVANFMEFNKKGYELFLRNQQLPPFENEPIKKGELLSTLEFAKKLAHFNKYFDYVIDSEIVDVFAKGDKEVVLNLPKEISEELRNKVFRYGGKSSILGYYSTLLKSFGIFENYYELPISELDVYNLQNILTDLHKKNNLPNEHEDYIIPSFLMMALAKEIQQLKNLIYNPSKEHIEFEYNKNHVSEISKLKEEFELLKSELDKTEHQVQKEKQEVTSVKDQLKNAQTTINNLTKANERLEQTISEFEEDKKELEHLKQFVFNLEDEEISTSNDEDKHLSMVNSLKDLKIVVIGGHENWVDKLKLTFPDYIYLTPEGATNRAIKNIHYDYILFNINKNSHGAYYRLQKELSRSKILYANHVNIERTVISLYQQIFN